MASTRALACFGGILATLALTGCPNSGPVSGAGGGFRPLVGGGSGSTGGGGNQVDAGGGGTGGGTSSATCTPCNTVADCPVQAVCTQYAGSDFCGHQCSGPNDCAASESCQAAVADDGTQTMVCIPTYGTCGSSGCGSCPSGSVCDPIAGVCNAGSGGGSGGAGGSGGGSSDAGCPGYDLPSTPSCCHSCAMGSGNCQANGCYNGYWCNPSSCACHAPIANCGAGGGAGGGTGGGTGTGGGSANGDGGVGITGGSVDHLYFAVVGDTRPSLEDDTSHYPTAIITQIFQDIAALNPQPQFIVATGDYMFASTSGGQANFQLTDYVNARANWPGVLFPVMGNHECTGASATDCSTNNTANLGAFKTSLLGPIGQTSLWYSIDVNSTAGAWTSKFLFTACNAWNTTQQSWLTTQLARPTTYTFVVRHMPLGSNGPCNQDMDPMLSTATFNGLLVGHTHTVSFSSTKKQLIEGVGGAPISGTSNYGYATLEQKSTGGFTVKQYDYQTNAVVNTYSLP